LQAAPPMNSPPASGSHRISPTQANATDAMTSLVPQRASRWLAPLAPLVLLACASLAPKLEPPRLEVSGVNFISGDRAHQQIGLKVHVTNPNARSIAVQRIDYGIALAGTDFARGTTAAPFTVPASGDTDFDLKLTADLLTALKVLGQHLGEHEIPYRVTGTLHLEEGVLRTVPFTSSGSLALR
jgi:LEA14-like dessication related protein